MIQNGELRQRIDEISELDMTPHNADDYLHHNKYHSFLKGCECEMKVIAGYGHNLIVNKYCKTHNVNCSKTGWEIGWFHGTKSENPAPILNRPLSDETVRQIKTDYKSGIKTLDLCKKYNLSYHTIYGIISNARYRDI